MPDNSDFVKSIEKATLQIISDEAKKMNRACMVVEASAKQKCPVDQGVLRASITSEVDVSLSGIVGRIGSNLEYAPYVHQGTGIYAANGDGRKTPWSYVIPGGVHKGRYWTRGQRPNPFLENAKLEKRSQVERILGG